MHLTPLIWVCDGLSHIPESPLAVVPICQQLKAVWEDGDDQEREGVSLQGSDTQRGCLAVKKSKRNHKQITHIACVYIYSPQNDLDRQS